MLSASPRAAILLTVLLARGAPVVAAEGVRRVYSLLDVPSLDTLERARDVVRKLPGASKVKVDRHGPELAASLDTALTDDQVVAALATAGIKARPGAGQGSYRSEPAYPDAADVQTLTTDGSRVGPLDRLRVEGKFTVFDVYAEWCDPCKVVDARLRELVAARGDIAVRRLNVVDFDSPLGHELGPGFEALPYVVVFSPTGKRTVVDGADLGKLDRALTPRP